MGLTKEERIERWTTETQRWLKGCVNSQPFDSGEVIWIDRQVSVEELLYEVGVPEKYQSAVAAQLECPCCDTEFELYYDVACKSNDEYLFDDMWRRWNEEYVELFEDFHAFLEAQPYLGTTHPLGREIYESITKFPKTNLKREVWYRARSVKDGRALRSADFHAPNPTKHAIGEGRFNHHGKSVLYLAKTPEGAAVEAISPEESVAWVQKFKITKLPDVLDLTNMDVSRCEGLPVLAVGLIHSGVLERNPERDGSWKPEYLVPRYIADCARAAGFKGIRFNAAQHYEQNLVIFQTTGSEITTSGMPKLAKVKESDRRSRFGAHDEDF